MGIAITVRALRMPDTIKMDIVTVHLTTRRIIGGSGTIGSAVIMVDCDVAVDGIRTRHWMVQCPYIPRKSPIDVITEDS